MVNSHVSLAKEQQLRVHTVKECQNSGKNIGFYPYEGGPSRVVVFKYFLTVEETEMSSSHIVIALVQSTLVIWYIQFINNRATIEIALEYTTMDRRGYA